MPNWSPQQELALSRVSSWLSTRDRQAFLLAGYAGTGKTTLAKHLAAGVEGEVYFAAFTGKAASVLARSGAPNVSTVHKLIYTTRERSRRHLEELEKERLAVVRRGSPVPAQLDKDIKAERDNLLRPAFTLNEMSPLKKAALVVIDEYSMLDERMGQDLLSFGVPVLALGDPGQLPPVRGRPYFTQRPDVMLTEIHRQAADNPILWMSREIREGRPLRPGKYGDSEVLRARDVGRDVVQAKVLAADQLLVGRNTTRANSNARLRELRGFSGVFPLKGDKLVCLRNNHDLGVLNGQLWTASHDHILEGQHVVLALDGEDGQQIAVRAHTDYFRGGQPQPQDMRDAESFDYGYALTVHKSQGSQWPAVTLFDEWALANRTEWLYTGVTRAAERVDVVVM